MCIHVFDKDREWKKTRETLWWFMTSCLRVCVFLSVCVSKWVGSSSGVSTTLRSPAEERPVCPSSSLGLWWASDGDDEMGPHRRRWRHPGMRKGLLLLAPLRSAARYARCYRPHGSVGDRKHIRSSSTLHSYEWQWKWSKSRSWMNWDIFNTCLRITRGNRAES